MGIFLQLSAETLTALFAMMQRVQGPQRQYVSVYNVPDCTCGSLGNVKLGLSWG